MEGPSNYLIQQENNNHTMMFNKKRTRILANQRLTISNVLDALKPYYCCCGHQKKSSKLT